MLLKREETISGILKSVADRAGQGRAAELNSFRDVRIRCSEGRSESVFCHQTIISSFSPLLASLLASSCSCKADVSIILDSVSIQTVQDLMGILYTGTLTVRGQARKAQLLSLARMLGMDLNNFCIEVPEPALSYPFPFNGFKPVAINHLYKKAGNVVQGMAGEIPLKKKRGRPRKVRPEEESQESQPSKKVKESKEIQSSKKVKKSRKARPASDKTEGDRDSPPEMFFQVANPTFTIKAGDKSSLNRSRKTEHCKQPAVIPEISLTFDLGLGGEADRTINLHQLADSQPAESQEREIKTEEFSSKYEVKKENNIETFAKIRVKSNEELFECGEAQRNKIENTENAGRDKFKNNFITFASPEEALETIEAEEEALNYSSDDENALIMDLSQSGAPI